MSTPLQKTFKLKDITLEKGQKIKRAIPDRQGVLHDHIYTISDYKFSGMYEDADQKVPLFYAVYAVSDWGSRIELTQEDFDNPELGWEVLA